MNDKRRLSGAMRAQIRGFIPDRGDVSPEPVPGMVQGKPNSLEVIEADRVKQWTKETPAQRHTGEFRKVEP